MAFSIASIQKTKTKPPLIALYGDGGVGKTTFAANAPDAIFIQTEDGAGSLELDAFPLVTEYSQLIEALNALLNDEHSFKTCVIDSLDHLEQRLVWPEVCRRGDDKGPRSNIEEFGYGKGYKYAMSLWHEIFDLIQRLRTEKNMAVILIAHCKIKRFESPLTDGYDRYMIKLHDGASEFVRESCDCVLFAHEETVVTKSDGGFGQKINRGISTGRRVIGCCETPSYQAKNRYLMPEKAPLAWAEFVKFIC